ncbi:hypothetical protein DPMN_111975 [Dreissena polymorpha]|uniref:Uncharacterized protein n=1 Tax=Dreissena polymorpha TaxID=45954 RepID=A0A9D4KET2_DREPO|nr:hypothetical protein DPMN_111975 [Dreissena polymorpha]
MCKLSNKTRYQSECLLEIIISSNSSRLTTPGVRFNDLDNYYDLINDALLDRFGQWSLTYMKELAPDLHSQPRYKGSAPATGFENGSNIIGTNLLTKFHEDRKINVASRVFTRKNALPPSSHVFQPTSIIFERIQSKHNYFQTHPRYHYWTINMASRMLTRKNTPSLVAMFLKQPKPFSNSSKISLGQNLLTKFDDDRKINVTSRVLTRKIAPPLIIFALVQDIIGMNLLTEFHEDPTINVASRVKNAPPLGGHVIQSNVTIFELIQDIIKTNLLTKFHQDWTINVASRVLTRKNALPPGGHVFQPTSIIFELVQDIIGMNLLTKKNALPLGSHVFQAKVTIFELIKDISGTNLLSKFHEDRKINVASRLLTRFYYGHSNVFQPTGIIFKLFYEDQTINVASRVKNAPPLGSHVFQANVTILELIQDIIETNLLTKFQEDWTINVASRE